MSAPGGGGGNPSHAERGGDKELAARARERFDARDYDGAVQILRQLLKVREGDPKVLHNIAVVEYYRSQCSATDEFLAALGKISWNGGVEGESGDDAGAGDDTESSVALYNQAVILIQNRQHPAAIAILEQLYRRIEPIEESLARKICFVLLDLYLARGDAEKAGFVIAYLEKTLTAALGAAAGGGAGSAAGGSAKATGGEQGTGKDGAQKDAGGKDGADSVARQLKLQLHVYKARFHLLTRSIKACKREIKSALNASTQNPAALFLKSNFEFARQNYRKSVKLLNSCIPRTADAQQAQPGSAAAAQMQRDWHAVAAMYFNDLGAVHHQMRRHAMASYYFGRALKENLKVYESSAVGDDGQRRNLAALSRDRRYELHLNSGVQRLLTGDAHGAFASLHASLPVFSGNPRVWLRIAEACIAIHADEVASGTPVGGSEGAHTSTALHCVAGDSGRRIIAACASTFESRPTQGDVAVDAEGAVGNGAASGSSSSSAVGGSNPVPSLLYAEWCLLTGLAILSRHAPSSDAPKGSASVGPQDGQAGASAAGVKANGAAGSGAPPSPAPAIPGYETPITCAGQCGSGGLVRPSEFASLRCAMLAALAFVQLSLDDCGSALVSATAVAAENGCPQALRFLAELYAAEALVLLGRVQDAAARLEKLRPEEIDALFEMQRQQQLQNGQDAGDRTTAAPTTTPASPWRDDTLVTAHPPSTLAKPGIALLLSFAAALATKGDLDRARACVARASSLSEAAGSPPPPHAVVLSAYIAIRRGDRVAALEAIRSYRLSRPPATPAATAQETPAPSSAAPAQTGGGRGSSGRGGNR